VSHPRHPAAPGIQPARASAKLLAGCVGLVALLGTQTGAQAQGPPPFGGFDTTACHGRAAHPLSNGRLIVRKPGDRLSLFSVRPDGSGLRRVTRPPGGHADNYPAAAPDGRRISFLRERTLYDGHARVIVHDLATGREHEVLPDAADPFHPAPMARPVAFSPTWSPDGRWIAISGLDFPGTVLVHPDGTGAKALDTGQWLLQQISWSPNGRCVAGIATWRRGAGSHFDGGGFAIVGAGGGRPNLFLPDFCPAAACAEEPEVTVRRWTADGRGLISALGVADDFNATSFDDVHLIRMGLSGRGARLIAKHLTLPVVSPDGRLVAGAQKGRVSNTRILTSRGRQVRRLRKLLVLAWMPRRR
jgi:hypothetical protein